jgi:hypothetical protein
VFRAGPVDDVPMRALPLNPNVKAAGWSRTDDAGNWLQVFLAAAGGSSPSAAAKDAGAALGFTESSLKRAVASAPDRFVVRSVGWPRRTVWALRAAGPDLHPLTAVSGARLDEHRPVAAGEYAASTRPGGADHGVYARTQTDVPGPLTAADVLAILGPACPQCGWTRGQHRPSGTYTEPCTAP